ncbi:MAG TPA: type VI secretion system baseplate subunit TssK [Longimicrobium sp.]|nr:type VI secretion system baseplate subunit TssK [Longimicrobium sp.]
MSARASGGLGCPPASSTAPAIAQDGCRPAPAPGQTTRYGTVPDPVAWYEGMLLAPQHFQQAALHGESLLGYHLAALSPWHWGVRRLVLDCPALRGGTLRVTELDAVMPDGLVVRRRDGDPVLETALAPQSVAAARGVLTVHLAVRPRSSAPEATGALARQECYAGEPVPDALTGEATAEVLRLRPRLSLIVSRERPRGFVSFPLARVRQAGGAWALTDDLPPLLALGTAQSLRDRCAALLCAVRGRAATLARGLRADRAMGRWGQTGPAHAALAALSAALPRLEALVHAPSVHPYPVYLALCDLAGHLAPAAGSGHVPPPFRGYDHDDPRRSFDSVLRFCEDALEEVQPGWTLLDFARRAGRFGLRAMALGSLPQPLLLCAVAPSGTDRQALAAWMAQARIAPASQLPGVMRTPYAIGAAREVVDAPAGLSAAENRLYLRVTPGTIGAGERLVVAPPASCADRGRPRALTLCVPASTPAATPFIPIPMSMSGPPVSIPAPAPAPVPTTVPATVPAPEPVPVTMTATATTPATATATA